MRRSILFSVMAPKRKAADVEEKDSTDTEKYFTRTDKEVTLLLQIANAYKNEKNKRREPEHFPNAIDSAKVFN